MAREVIIKKSIYGITSLHEMEDRTAIIRALNAYSRALSIVSSIVSAEESLEPGKLREHIQNALSLEFDEKGEPYDDAG